MGGGQWQVLRLVRGLAARGDRPVLLARPDSELLGRALAEGFHAEPFRWTNWPRTELIHAHDARAHAAAALFRGAPLVVARRVAYPIKTGPLSRFKYQHATHFIAVSRFVSGILQQVGIPADKIDVVYDGVPLLPMTEHREKVITPPNKSFEGFLASDDLERDLATAAAFVYISESEGLGSAILLAMSAGVPVVASNIGGIPEIISDGEDGILVKNTRGEIDAAVQSVREQSVLFGTRARQKIIDRFQEAHMVEGTLNVYRKLLSSNV